MSIFNLFNLTDTMLKIGCIGFGGGSALIPVMEEELVKKKSYISEEDFNGSMMIASITPGALPVEIATGIGYKMYGQSGMIAAATAMAFPGSILTLIFIILMNYFGNHAKMHMSYISVGVTAFIITMLLHYVYQTVHSVEERKEIYQYILIITLVFLLTAEEHIYRIFSIDQYVIFGMTTIEILTLSFFIIFSIQGTFRNLPRVILTIFIGMLYILCSSNMEWISIRYQLLIKGGMFLMAACGAFQAMKESPYRKKIDFSRMLKVIFSWGSFLIILSIPAILISRDIFRLLWNGMLSSVMSFGGGDAYLSIAQGIFVEGGFVDYHEFYGTIVSVANILPGSILCKVLCGASYLWGYNMHQSWLEGLLIALSGFACSVTASGLIFMVVYFLYETYEKIRIIRMIKKYIRPIISGLLINVMFSLYFAIYQMPVFRGDVASFVPWITVGVLVLNLWIYHLRSIHFFHKVVISAIVSWIVFSLI